LLEALFVFGHNRPGQPFCVRDQFPGAGFDHFDIATEPFVESGDEPSVDGLLLLGERCERPVQSARVMVLDGCPEQILLVGAGFRDTSLTLLAKVPFDRHWSVQAFVQIRYLLGDAANSPLTQSRVQPTFAGFFAYSF